MLVCDICKTQEGVKPVTVEIAYSGPTWYINIDLCGVCYDEAKDKIAKHLAATTWRKYHDTGSIL